MRVRTVSFLAFSVFCLVVLCAPQQKQVKHGAVHWTSPASAQDMYFAYCAVCHGKEGKGNGPAAEALKVQPPDLTTLAKKNGGSYPSDHVRNAITGDLSLPAHGSKDMPVWGYLFWRMSQGQSSQVQLRTSNLNQYIESMQQKD